MVSYLDIAALLSLPCDFSLCRRHHCHTLFTLFPWRQLAPQQPLPTPLILRRQSLVRRVYSERRRVYGEGSFAGRLSPAPQIKAAVRCVSTGREEKEEVARGRPAKTTAHQRTNMAM
jgi:hypothetical protein